MAITTIPWSDGSGDNIYVSAPSQTGTQTVSVSSDANTGAARSQTVTFTASGITKTLTVNQEAGGPQEYTLTVNFSALDDDHAYAAITNATDAYKGTGNSAYYAVINPTTGNDAVTYFYFKFDTSSIPANATITSISCSVRNWMASGVTGANRFSSVYMTMASGTTEKGTAIDIKSNYSNAVRTFTAGTWTASEVQDVRVKFYAQRGTANTGTIYQMRVYGGTLTIKYTV